MTAPCRLEHPRREVDPVDPPHAPRREPSPVRPVPQPRSAALPTSPPSRPRAAPAARYPSRPRPSPHRSPPNGRTPRAVRRSGSRAVSKAEKEAMRVSFSRARETAPRRPTVARRRCLAHVVGDEGCDRPNRERGRHVDRVERAEVGLEASSPACRRIRRLDRVQSLALRGRSSALQQARREIEASVRGAALLPNGPGNLGDHQLAADQTCVQQTDGPQSPSTPARLATSLTRAEASP